MHEPDSVKGIRPCRLTPRGRIEPNSPRSTSVGTPFPVRTGSGSQERALLPGQPVVGLRDPVAQDEPALLELRLDREHGRLDPFVVGGQEADQREQQRRGVERVGLVVLAEHAAVGHAVREDVLADLLSGRPPLGGELEFALERRQPGPTIRRHPAHQLRGHVLLGLAARLPDPLIGLLPDVERAPDLVLEDRPQPLGNVAARPRVQVGPSRTARRGTSLRAGPAAPRTRSASRTGECTSTRCCRRGRPAHPCGSPTETRSPRSAGTASHR